MRYPDIYDLHDQAAFWYTRFESGSITDEEKQAFESWLLEGPDHAEAFREMGPLTGNFAALAEDIHRRASGRNSNRIPTDLEQEIQDTIGLVQEHRKRTAERRQSSRRQFLQVAASFLIVAVGVWFWRSVETSTPISDYKTHIGEQKTVMLQDGSILTLNTASEVSVALTNSVRRLHLKHGEVYFQVAKDKVRPFEVLVGNSFVRALGTEFNILTRGDSVAVTVAEGTVEVKSGIKTFPSTEAEILSIGDQVILEQAAMHRQTLQPENLQQLIQWRDGTIVFDNKDLQQIIAEIQPYIPEKIIIAGEDVASLQVGGVLEISNVDHFFTALALSHPVEVVRQEDIILLTKKDA